MSMLKERLNRLKKETAPVEPTERTESALPEMPSLSLGASWDRLGAYMHHNDWGQFIIRRLTYPFHFAHGTYRLGELLGEAERLAALSAAGSKSGKRKARNGDDAVARTIDPQSTVSHDRLLFLDTETTGLGVGAGNVAFMVGIGYYERDAFIVEQLFIRNPSEEAAMLHHLHRRLSERDMLVSYNGKCFDWPILKNRFILNRQKESALDPLHFDFLYPSRSLWRNTLPSCRLSSVERERLGLSRIEDVPGSLAPALYFQYLAEGDPTLVAGVFEHNEKDVLTLACLAVHFSQLIAGTVSRTNMEPEELYRLALWLDKLGFCEDADEALRELLDREAEQVSEYWLPVGQIYKRQGRLDLAVSLWERAIERKRRSRIAALTPYVELAMYYEHQHKDYERALHYAEQALERAQVRHTTAFRLDGKASEEIEAFHKRVERLRAKLDVSLQKSASAFKRASGKRREKTNDGLSQQTLPISDDVFANADQPKRKKGSL